jgi:hypothetical protein
MVRPRHRLGVLGLSAFVLGLIAISAVTGLAKAEKGVRWMVGGEPVTLTLQPTVAVSQVESQDIILLTKISGSKVEILCTGLELSGFSLLLEGEISSGSKGKFKGCLIKLNEVKSTPCEPHNGAEKGVILTGELKNARSTHESEEIIRVEPKTGETLATVETSAECPIGSKIPLIGKLALKDAVSLASDTSTHLFSAGSLTELWAVSQTEEHIATVDGSIVLELGGAHKGLDWRIEKSEAVPTWRVQKTDLSSKLSPSLIITELEGKDEILLTEILKSKIEKLCTAAELIGAKLETEGKISSGAKVRFSGCVFKINGKLAPTCEPHTGAEKGVIVTNATKGLIVLGEGKGLLLLTPVSGETFITVELGEECAVGEKVPLLGRLTLSISGMGSEEVAHLVAQGPLTELWLISKTEEHKVTLDGSAMLALTGEHSGMTWSGVPG